MPRKPPGTAPYGPWPLKAYVAHDGDEGWAVVYATNGATARRYAANEMDTDFYGVETCYRAPGLDQYKTVQNIPVEAMISMNWWFECYQCGCRIDSDTEHPIGFHMAAFCCAEHARLHRIETVTKAWIKAEMNADMGLALLAICPDAVILNRHVYVEDTYNIKEASVTFVFPGCSKYGSAEYKWSVEDTVFTLWCSPTELDAWNAYREKRDAAKKLVDA